MNIKMNKNEYKNKHKKNTAYSHSTFRTRTQHRTWFTVLIQINTGIVLIRYIMDFSSNCAFDRTEEQVVKQEASCPPISGGIAK